MTKPDMEISQSKIKASHIYEIVDSKSAATIAGKRFHFIGAGGVGMSGLALLLMKNKAIVSGSDYSDSPVVEKLCQNGADIKVGHSLDNLTDKIDAVVISAAVREGNPELELARKRGIKVYKYAQMLGELMNRYDGVAVSGTHGKSTTSGWLVYCLKRIGVEVSFIIGADICQLGSSSGVGDSRFFVAEACEYDRSFLNLKPQIGCILNIEADHLDYYKDEDEIVDAFTRFALGIKPGGVLIANGQDSNVAKVVCKLPVGFKCETFGFNENCNFSARNIRLIDRLNRFDIYRNGSFLGNAKISLPGKHNILNAMAVVAMAVNAGVKVQDILVVLDDFTGMDRRIMFKSKINGITVLDDYAHHPTEIKASLGAIRQRYQPKRIWCVFQPHQYSRTRFLLDDFTESFTLADITIVPEIYFVRDTEAEKKRISSQVLVERIKATGSNAVFIDGFSQICDYLKKNVAAGDLVVTMGAGNIGKVANEYIQWLGANS